MQKPTKAFADMLAEIADKLEAVLSEMYPDGGNQGALMVSPEFLRRKSIEYKQIATRPADKALAYLQSKNRASG